MSGFDEAYYEDLQGRLRAVLIEVADDVPAEVAGLVDESIDHNECGVALEVLSDALVEAGLPMDRAVLRRATALAEQMNLDAVVGQLRSLTD